MQMHTPMLDAQTSWQGCWLGPRAPKCSWSLCARQRQDRRWKSGPKSQGPWAAPSKPQLAHTFSARGYPRIFFWFMWNWHESNQGAECHIVVMCTCTHTRDISIYKYTHPTQKRHILLRRRCGCKLRTFMRSAGTRVHALPCMVTGESLHPSP